MCKRLSVVNTWTILPGLVWLTTVSLNELSSYWSALSQAIYTSHTYTQMHVHYRQAPNVTLHYTHIHTCMHTHIRLFTVTLTVALNPPLVQVYTPASDKLTELIIRIWPLIPPCSMELYIGKLMYVYSRTSIIQTPVWHFNVKSIQINEFVRICELSDKIHYLASYIHNAFTHYS